MRPLARYVPGQAVLETIGRKSGLPRQTPVGGRLDGDCFWMVSDHGGRHWRTGTAHLMPDDDPGLRLKRLPRANGLLVRLLGTELLTIRVDLERV